MRRHSGIGTRLATGLMAMAIAVVPFRAAVALITGGEGNKPIADPGWPKGRGRRSSTTRAASPGGKGRRSAAASGTPSAAAMPGH